jgi:hypothetical protein
MASAIAGLASVASAATITSGTASYQFIDPWSSSTSGNGAFITGTGVTDQLFKNTWYYRTPNNNQNRFFSSLDTPTQSVSGDTALITYTNAGPGVAGFERFNAQFRVKITQTGAAAARVDTKLTFSNASTATRTFQIFNLVDLDLQTAAGDGIAMEPGSSNQIAKYTDSSGTVGYHAGYASNAYNIGPASSVQSQIGTGSGNLSSTTLAGASTDKGSAFQWTVTLAAGQSIDIYSSFSINTLPVPTPGSLALLGMGGLVAARRRR